MNLCYSIAFVSFHIHYEVDHDNSRKVKESSSKLSVRTPLLPPAKIIRTTVSLAAEHDQLIGESLSGVANIRYALNRTVLG